MNIGIIGSGFGLYGYLPAIVNSGNVPFVLKSRFPLISERVELLSFENSCKSTSSIGEMVQNCDAIVLATPPNVKLNLLFELIHDSGVSHLFLEKPLGVSPYEGSKILSELVKEKKSFSIAYLFLWTDWFKKILEMTKQSHESIPLCIDITWTVAKPDQSWKSEVKLGGGLVDFLATHFFAMYWKLGYKEDDLVVEMNQDFLHLTSINKNFPKLTSELQYGDTPSFNILTRGSEIDFNYQAENPFGRRNQNGTPDNRIVPLSEFISSALVLQDIDFLQVENFVSNLRYKGHGVQN
jgi:predicted dehydrogenase